MTILTPEQFGAKGNGVADDTAAFQAMLDSAVMVNADCECMAWRYKITKPLLIKHGNFANYTIRIKGNSLFWDVNRTTIIFDCKYGAALSVQNGKGVVIEGISFLGKYTTPKLDIYNTPWSEFTDPTITDSVTAPHCAICVDPEQTPNRGGSTGITIRDCSFRNFTGAINISPSGSTLNGEMILIENCRADNVKYFLSGGQAQEKTNIVQRCGLWGNIHTCFVFGKYGQGHPGQWVARDCNTAGKVGNLIHRASQNFSAMTFDSLHLESIGSIGYWTSGKNMNDIMMNCMVQLQAPQYNGNRITVVGDNVTYFNTVFRYYSNGVPCPMLFKGRNKYINSSFETNPVTGLRYTGTETGYTIEGSQVGELVIESGSTVVNGIHNTGDTIVFYAPSNNDFLGMGQVSQSIKGFSTVKNLTIKSGRYKYGLYKNTGAAAA